MKNYLIAASAFALLIAASVAGAQDPTAMTGTMSSSDFGASPMTGTSATDYVKMAADGDNYEIQSSRLALTRSKSAAAIMTFATQMLTDHTKSTKMVQAAAKADHVALNKPSMSVGQRTDLTALKAVPAGKTKDDLYVKQQKAAHADALALMQDYGSNGSALHLKSAAEEIAPVVEKHQSMLATM